MRFLSFFFFLERAEFKGNKEVYVLRKALKEAAKIGCGFYGRSHD